MRRTVNDEDAINYIIIIIIIIIIIFIIIIIIINILGCGRKKIHLRIQGT